MPKVSNIIVLVVDENGRVHTHYTDNNKAVFSLEHLNVEIAQGGNPAQILFRMAEQFAMINPLYKHP